MADVHVKLAPAGDHIRAGRFDQALALLQRLNQQHPGQPAVLGMLMEASARAGRKDQAAYHAQAARRLVAGRKDDLLELGNMLSALGLIDEAIATYEAALAIDPAFSAASVGLSACHFRAYRLSDVVATCRRALEHDPGHAMLRCNLGVALVQGGRAREAVRILREVARDNPGDAVVTSALAASTNYAGDVTPEESMAAHAAYGALLERRAPTPPRPRPIDPDPDRRLRVGIVSADLRAHPCGTFIEPWLARHTRDRFEILCYSVAPVEDSASARLRGHVGAWRAVARLSAEALAQQIRQDKIDIVLELSGHTAGHRLGALHLRPAPVQVTYFGYPNTTGVRAIDARLVDSITDPAGSEALATERLVRLDPCFLCFPPPLGEGVPGPGPLPAERAGTITFGSFNNVAKIDDRTIELWAAVLGRVAGSRLLLKYYALSQEGVRADLLARFAAAGVGDRIDLDPPGRGTIETLRAYQRVDIALDTFPYHGTTTTCEALYMGCPVVTLMGRSCAARVSGSILRAAGRPEWAAETAEQFVTIAAGLAGDRVALAGIRAGLREAVLGSALCDQAAFVARLEGALRGLWREACAGA